MSSADNPSPAPRGAPSPLTDAIRVATLPDQIRQSLFDRVAEFDPTSSGLDDDEVLSLASGSTIQPRTIQATIRLAVYLSGKSRSAQEINKLAVRVANASEGQLDTARVETILNALRVTAGDLASRFEVLEEIESAMPSLRHCSIAADLRNVRALPMGQNLRPVAVVRLLLDEGEALVFQCVPAKLEQLRTQIGEALGEFAELAAHPGTGTTKR